jgi:uncharacterized membrane protein
MVMLAPIVLASAGFALSLYMFMIERKLKQNPTYKPVCNLSARISCTKALESAYARPLGVSNALLGLLFYPMLIVLTFIYPVYVYYASLAACCISFFLALILYFRIKTFCLVCSALYVINALLLIISYYSR